MAGERFGFALTVSGPFGPFASLNDLSQSLQASSAHREDNYRNLEDTTAITTDNIFQYNPTSTVSISPQQQHLAWYDQVHPIPYPSSSSNIFKKESLDDKRDTDNFEDDNDRDQDDGEQEPVECIESEEQESKKRKCNKPIFSCRECVGKEMRCDRGRPHICLGSDRLLTDWMQLSLLYPKRNRVCL
ncbi:hypothetical protein TSTA_017830 [Talaromyces stipitatus ATCC 10500]|uniref:Zn(2)-C6 fungal-type domain-containing protein n=1 Tax=Talaromyces stipitatus (strain ATCC 10500 / CBS 375.48 / QM 6759 / NRRL 1006) TaxID=441959 RepID=B8MFH5_TALSN|nr:uncharacterized protein TSTA_017830 [Talaromyces stipitatus ATCC 10500]EED16709.1 hypothetical protein TSTA_017830 [Talaromyces stipitatus ATCC 10500]